MRAADLLVSVSEWLKWVQKQAEQNAKMLSIAALKPENTSHNALLIRDSEGRIWVECSTVYQQVERAGDFGHYYARPSSMTIPINKRYYNGGRAMDFVSSTGEEVWFVAKGSDERGEDWCWVPCERGEKSDLEIAVADVVYYQRAIALGKKILLISEKELDKWVADRAKEAPIIGDKRHYDSCNADWRNFCSDFGLGYGDKVDSDMPDMGSVRCALHKIIDEAAGLMDTVYMH